MKKKCRVYKKLPTNREGGYKYQPGGASTPPYDMYQYGNEDANLDTLNMLAYGDKHLMDVRDAQKSGFPIYGSNPGRDARLKADEARTLEAIRAGRAAISPQLRNYFDENVERQDERSLILAGEPKAFTEITGYPMRRDDVGSPRRADIEQPIRQEGGMSQSSKFQPIYKQKTQEFLAKLGQNKQNFAEDEGTADRLAIFNAIAKDIPEFKSGGTKKWMQKATKSMHRKGTVGSFTDHCGGKVTAECIEKGLNSPVEKVRNMAKFAKAAQSIAKQWGGSVMSRDEGQLPMAADGMQTPGYEMTGDLSIVDPNMDAWQDSIDNLRGRNKRQFNRGMDRLNYGITGLAQAPTRYTLGEDQPLFEGQGDVDLTQFDVTGYTPGEGRRKSYLDYSAKGRPTPKPQFDPSQLPSFDKFNLPTHQVRGEVNNESLFPDLNPNPNMYGSDMMNDPANFGLDPNLTTGHGQMDFIHNLNQRIGEQTGTEGPVYEPPGVVDNTLTDEGQLELTRQSRLKTAMQDNPYLASEAILGAQNLITGIGNTAQANRQEAALARKQSETFNRLQTTDKDPGDRHQFGYLQPNQFTRWGAGTKVAQGGYEVEDERYLTPFEIEELLAQGYELEYMD